MKRSIFAVHFLTPIGGSAIDLTLDDGESDSDAEATHNRSSAGQDPQDTIREFTDDDTDDNRPSTSKGRLKQKGKQKQTESQFQTVEGSSDGLTLPPVTVSKPGTVAEKVSQYNGMSGPSGQRRRTKVGQMQGKNPNRVVSLPPEPQFRLELTILARPL